jgi:hypothetical protein
MGDHFAGLTDYRVEAIHLMFEKKGLALTVIANEEAAQQVYCSE